MTLPAIDLQGIGKWFRVPRAASLDDARRERLSRGRDRFWALRDVSLRLERGRTLGLVGGNGSGKSTLLKILAGVLTPDTGTCEIEGRVGALLELGAGFHPDLTGIENVYLNGSLLGLSTRDIDALLPRIIEFAELEHFMDMPVRHYSSGMSTRLGFAVASCLSPDILLLDETFVAGDQAFQARALAHIFDLKSRGTTMIVVSHYVDLVTRLADEVLWLDRGRALRYGDPAPILSEYQHTRSISLRQAGETRANEGIESAFVGDMAADAGIAIESVAIRTDGPPSEGAPAVADGGTVCIDVMIAHDADAPATCYVETAWVLNDGRIMAQSRSELVLGSGPGPTRTTLCFDHWRLREGDWRIAVALSPVPCGEPDPDAVATYYAVDRAAGRVRSQTRQETIIPVMVEIPHTWSNV